MSEDKQKPRHKPKKGYARGDETRQRIIDAAIRLFGERGYEGASTREIAKQADVNAPALQYYFDGKEGLYRACAEHIAESSWAHFSPMLERAQAALDASAPREALIAAFSDIQDAMFDHLLGSIQAQNRKLFAVQDQASHGLSMLYGIIDRNIRPRMREITMALITRITGMDPAAPQTLIRILTLHGQVMVFHVTQRSVLADLRWDNFSPEHLDQLKQIVRAQTRTLINSWSLPEDG